MADNTKIEWADATANFWIGCTKLSPACDHCYAEADWDHRKHRVLWGPHGDRSFVKAGEQVVRKMQRNAAAFIAEHGRKPRIFVNSLSDFADNHRSILPEWRAKVWQLARECPDVILLILTKRPQNLPTYLPTDWGAGYPNVWIGTTAENQTEANRRVPVQLAIPAARRFLSCEPLLEPVDLERIPSDGGVIKSLSGGIYRPYGATWDSHRSLDWVIVGGESGLKARPMHPDWARSLRDQCAAAGVPFLFKQWGEWAPLDDVDEALLGDGLPGADLMPDGFACVHENPMSTALVRVGKKRAGRLLDGCTHDGFPHG